MNHAISGMWIGWALAVALTFALDATSMGHWGVSPLILSNFGIPMAGSLIGFLVGEACVKKSE